MIKVTGQHTDAAGEPLPLAYIEFRAVMNAGEVLKGTTVTDRTDEKGCYELAIKQGRYAVYAQVAKTTDVDFLGECVIGPETPSSVSLLQLFELSTPLPPESVQEVQQQASQVEKHYQYVVIAVGECQKWNKLVSKNATTAIEAVQQIESLSSAVSSDTEEVRRLAELVSEVTGQTMVYKGAWDASTGRYPIDPNLAVGWMFKVSRGGVIGGVEYLVNDSIIFNGEDWDHISNKESVVSVNGKTGHVSISKADLDLDKVRNVASYSQSELDKALAKKLNVESIAKAANKLSTARKISLAGGAEGFAEWDGSGDVTIKVLVKDKHQHAIASIQGLEDVLKRLISNDDARLSDSREWLAETVTQAEASEGKSPTRRAWSALRVRQAIDAVVGQISNATSKMAGWMSPADKSKLDGIASSATKNSHDAHLLARENHTGMQPISSIKGLSQKLAEFVSTSIVGKANGVAALGGDGKVPADQLPPVGMQPHNHDERYFTRHQADTRYLKQDGTATNAKALGGIKPEGYLREDVKGYLNKGLYVRGQLVVEEGHRNVGLIGTYDAKKTQQIWSMGENYLSDANGSDFGNLYGLAYKHENNTTGGAMAGGHQAVWCQSGKPTCSLGNGIWTAGDITAFSDKRVKRNLVRIPGALAKVSQLNGYTFERTDVMFDEHGHPLSPLRQTGLVAQEVLAVLPEAVRGGPNDQNKDGYYSVAYGNLVGLLVEAIKEQQVQINQLKRKH
ncbi:tail fiber domain-containing protein [Salinivibrio kushneri]|uniref:Peptidase S74 domain-containing protein n=1 Tax=Salinivibrio kushneri TaxID=1908198 RepID=A0AB36K5X2_9GAMM|nr:tail fiber domain-containing protein [Salinivibrio kushneri]OOE43435.1 hypothetical protein BZG09_10670 [Salinivibrio kushneri]